MEHNSVVLFDRATLETGAVVGQGSVNGVQWRRCAVLPSDLPRSPQPSTPLGVPGSPQPTADPGWRRCALPAEAIPVAAKSMQR